MPGQHKYSTNEGLGECAGLPHTRFKRAQIPLQYAGYAGRFSSDWSYLCESRSSLSLFSYFPLAIAPRSCNAIRYTSSCNAVLLAATVSAMRLKRNAALKGGGISMAQTIKIRKLLGATATSRIPSARQFNRSKVSHVEPRCTRPPPACGILGIHPDSARAWGLVHRSLVETSQPLTAKPACLRAMGPSRIQS